MTIGDITHQAAATRGLPLLEVDMLLAHVLDATREYIYSHPERSLTTIQFKQFNSLVKRRQAGEPIAYLIGHKEFYGLDFIVNKHVLIPRPDTELLVDIVLNDLRGVKSSSTIIADIGTGSGNIAIAIKKHFSACTMLATDVSKPAVEVAKANAKNNNTKISFFQGDVLHALPKKYQQAIDVITFNAPYLTKTEARKKNLAYEPQVALTPTGKPTELIERMLQQADAYLAPRGRIYLEIGHRQSTQVTALCKKYFPASRVTITQDLGKFDRVVSFTKR